MHRKIEVDHPSNRRLQFTEVHRFITIDSALIPFDCSNAINIGSQGNNGEVSGVRPDHAEHAAAKLRHFLFQ